MLIPNRANPKQVDEKRGKKEEAERRRNAQAFQKAAKNKRKKHRQGIKGKNEEACDLHQKWWEIKIIRYLKTKMTIYNIIKEDKLLHEFKRRATGGNMVM